MLAGSGDGDDIHEADWESVISSDFVVNLDVGIISVSADLKCLLAGKGVLQSVAEENSERNALSQLVGSSRWAGGVHTSKFVQTPVGRCKHALHMLFGSSCLQTQSAPTHSNFATFQTP